MKNSEAIKWLEYLRGGYTREGGIMCQAVDMAIEALKPASVRTNADRIRQMTDEELANFMVIQAIMGAISVNGIQDKAVADKIVKEIIMEHEADEDISAALIWLKNEVSRNDKSRGDTDGGY